MIQTLMRPQKVDFLTISHKRPGCGLRIPGYDAHFTVSRSDEG